MRRVEIYRPHCGSEQRAEISRQVVFAFEKRLPVILNAGLSIGQLHIKVSDSVLLRYTSYFGCWRMDRINSVP